MRRTLPLLCSVLLLVAFAGGVWYLSRPISTPHQIASVKAESAALERERLLLLDYLESPACAAKR